MSNVISGDTFYTLRFTGDMFIFAGATLIFVGALLIFAGAMLIFAGTMLIDLSSFVIIFIEFGNSSFSNFTLPPKAARRLYFNESFFKVLSFTSLAIFSLLISSYASLIISSKTCCVFILAEIASK